MNKYEYSGAWLIPAREKLLAWHGKDYTPSWGEVELVASAMADAWSKNSELLAALENLERVAGIAMTEDDPARVAARIAIAKARRR